MNMEKKKGCEIQGVTLNGKIQQRKGMKRNTFGMISF